MAMPALSDIAANAFKRVYGRDINSEELWASIFSGLFGWQYKYKGMSQGWDKNKYTIAEQIIFFFPRIAKNLAKLGTEYLWLFLADTLQAAHSHCWDKARNSKNPLAKLGWGALSGLSGLISLVPRLIHFVGRAITSPAAEFHELLKKRAGSFFTAACSLMVTLYAAVLLVPLLAPLVLGASIAAAIGLTAIKLAVCFGVPLLTGLRKLIRSYFEPSEELIMVSGYFVPFNTNQIGNGFNKYPSSRGDLPPPAPPSAPAAAAAPVLNTIYNNKSVSFQGIGYRLGGESVVDSSGNEVDSSKTPVKQLTN